MLLDGDLEVSLADAADLCLVPLVEVGLFDRLSRLAAELPSPLVLEPPFLVESEAVSSLGS